MFYIVLNAIIIIVLVISIAKSSKKYHDWYWEPLILISFLCFIIVNLISLAPSNWYGEELLEKDYYETKIMLNGVETNKELFYLNERIEHINNDIERANSYVKRNWWAGILFRDDKYSHLEPLPLYYDVDDIPSE